MSIRMRLFVAAMLATCAVVSPERAHACGCLAPPAVTEGQYAVNQQSEMIIFEVEPGFVTAHVLIRYAGAPEQFAWIVPVPTVPELSLSDTLLFGILDQTTRPNVYVSENDVCPSQRW